MAEPLSIVAAALSGTYVVRRTTGLVSSIYDAPIVVELLENDPSALQTRLQSLHDIIAYPELSQSQSSDVVLSLVQSPL